jgi:GR25 family glycosyltransferase involved in LPS biosynthesis
MDQVGFYCLSYKNSGRERAESLFAKLNMNVTFYKGVDYDDIRLRGLDTNLKKIWSTTYGHLYLIRQFYESDKPYGIICEDDIVIRNDFITHLPTILDDFNSLNLDILLLGYLCEFEIDTYNNFPTKKISRAPFKYLDYPNDTWGTQMYLISKSQAYTILCKYYYGYAEKTLKDKTIEPFSADWTITKTGNRALIYPLVAIEDCKKELEHENHSRAHKNCYTFSYKPELFD